jgi:hypothetical protein
MADRSLAVPNRVPLQGPGAMAIAGRRGTISLGARTRLTQKQI